MNLYIINGAAASGKSTFCSLVKEKLGEGHCYEISTVDLVKEVAKVAGWNGEKTAKNRKFLSDLKDLLTQWDDVPVRNVKQRIRILQDEYRNWFGDDKYLTIFINVREPEEIRRLCNELGARSVFISRSIAENEVASNHADQNVKNYDYDIVINNNDSLEILKNVVDKFVKNEKLQYNYDIK